MLGGQESNRVSMIREAMKFPHTGSRTGYEQLTLPGVDFIKIFSPLTEGPIADVNFVQSLVNEGLLTFRYLDEKKSGMAAVLHIPGLGTPHDELQFVATYLGDRQGLLAFQAVSAEDAALFVKWLHKNAGLPKEITNLGPYPRMDSHDIAYQTKGIQPTLLAALNEYINR